MTTATMNKPMFAQAFINPIKALHKLKEVGFTQKQAEAQLEIFSGYVEQIEATLASKRDLKELELKLETQIKPLALEMNARFKEIAMKLVIKIGVITSAVVGFFYMLEKFF